ncbi:MAG: thiamine pyrophosphate-requiring protein [Chloroflexi bacterium]|nr:thiamine pyrophosphate-requiring protein [Chloroflexota bacterium]
MQETRSGHGAGRRNAGQPWQASDPERGMAMALQERPAVFDEQWGAYGAEEWADALVGAMKLGGIDHLFFVSGSEIGFYQEAVARASTRGWPTPRLVTVLHEGTALNAALGVSMVTGQPSATAAHVDVGLFNYGAALHSAWKASYPVLITSGTGPRAYPNSMAGARNNTIQWYQEPRDQGEIVRQYTKMDHRLEHQDNPGLMVSRLLQVAMSEPKGPVYLAVPRETAMLPMAGSTRFPTRDELGVARPSWPDPADARTVAQWLIEASDPCIYTAHSGRNPGSVAELVRLAELLAVPVMADRVSSTLTFPSTHPLFGTGPAPKDADALLIIESPVPFIPPEGSPRPGAKIAWVDVDPVQSRFKTMEYRADLWLPVDAGCAARAIYDAATGMLSRSDLSRIADRRARLEERKRELAAAADERALAAGARRPIHPMWVAHQLGKILEPDAVLLDDALSNSSYVQTFQRRSEPGTFFRRAASSGGWGSGAAFGAKLARPERDVVLATGDGYFMFSNPVAGLWCAQHYGAPYLTVVFVNRSYSTGTTTLRTTYPEGEAVTSGNYDGGVFDPPPDFAKVAEAANGYGETVREPEDVAPALRRGLSHVRNGTPAVIAVMLPTLVEEMDS